LTENMQTQDKSKGMMKSNSLLGIVKMNRALDFAQIKLSLLIL